MKAAYDADERRRHADVAGREPDEPGERHVAVAEAAAEQRRHEGEHEVDRPEHRAGDRRPAQRLPVPRGEGRERELGDEQRVCRPRQSARQAVHVRVDPGEARRRRRRTRGRPASAPTPTAARSARRAAPRGRASATGTTTGRTRGERAGLVVEAVATGREPASEHLTDEPTGDGERDDEPPRRRRGRRPRHRRDQRCPHAGRATRVGGRRDIAASGAGRPVMSATCSVAWCRSMSVPAATAQPRSRAGALQGGLARAVDDVEDGAGRRRAVGRPGKRVEARHRRWWHGADDGVDVGRVAHSPRCDDLDGQPGRRACASGLGSRTRSRTMKATRPRPRPRPAATAERAVAPMPTTSTLGGSVHPATRSAVVMPWTSVLWAASRRPVGVATRVLADPVTARDLVDDGGRRERRPP